MDLNFRLWLETGNREVAMRARDRFQRNDAAIAYDPNMAKLPSSEFADLPIPDALVPQLVALKSQGMTGMNLLRWLREKGVETTLTRMNDRIRRYEKDNQNLAAIWLAADEDEPYKPADKQAVARPPHPRKATDLRKPVDRPAGFGFGAAGGNRGKFAHTRPINHIALRQPYRPSVDADEDD
jgi:hypothetical protein